jgi:hypothetical protein
MAIIKKRRGKVLTRSAAKNADGFLLLVFTVCGHTKLSCHINLVSAMLLIQLFGEAKKKRSRKR